MTAKTSTERSQLRRARLDAEKASEVRGIIAPAVHHDEIKLAARKVAAKLAKRPTGKGSE